jgi:hypothetical protein
LIQRGKGERGNGGEGDGESGGTGERGKRTESPSFAARFGYSFKRSDVHPSHVHTFTLPYGLRRFCVKAWRLACIRRCRS